MPSSSSFRWSVGLNVLLGIAALALYLRHAKPSLPAAAPAVAAPSGPAVVRSVARPEYPGTATPTARRRWLVDELRGMGVPNKVLARIVIADLDWAWNKRGGEVSLQTHGDPDTLALLKLENASSLDSEMKAALGEEGFRQWDHENMLREANRGKIALTPAEIDGSYALWKELQARELELKKARVKGEMDEIGIAEEFGRLVGNFETRLKALLGEERYAQARQLHDPSAAVNLRESLATAQPNEVQFQELLRTQQAWNELRQKLDLQFKDDPASSAYAEQLSVLEEAREEEYRRVLGADAFAAVQKEQDPSYGLMRKNAGLWGLDDHKIDSVYGSIKYFEKTVQDYQAQVRARESQGQAVDWSEVSRNLQHFTDQTEQALEHYLGKDSFTKLQRNGVFPFTLQNQRPVGAPIKPSDRG